MTQERPLPEEITKAMNAWKAAIQRYERDGPGLRDPFEMFTARADLEAKIRAWGDAMHDTGFRRGLRESVSTLDEALNSGDGSYRP